MTDPNPTAQSIGPKILVECANEVMRLHAAGEMQVIPKRDEACTADYFLNKFGVVGADQMRQITDEVDLTTQLRGLAQLTMNQPEIPQVRLNGA